MLTAAQLILYATQTCKAPGFVSQAADLLNARLSSMARRYDFDVLKKFAIVNVLASNQQYSLPTDYVRGLDVRYYIGGLPQEIPQMPLDEYNAVNAGFLTQAYPSNWASDPAPTPPQLYLYPMPNVSFPLTIRYASQPADIPNAATSTTVPWFPDSMCLLALLTADLAPLTDDDRVLQLQDKASGMFEAFMKMQGDQEGYAKTVKLGSPFRNSRLKLPASKLTGF